MIYLHKNGVTIVADKKAKVGQTYELKGEKYLVVNNFQHLFCFYYTEKRIKESLLLEMYFLLVL